MTEVTTAQHTPGPWDYTAFGSYGGDGPSCFRVGRKDWGAIADTSGWTAQDEANACLIAAAPELLESIEALLVVSNSDEVLREIKLMPKKLQTARVDEHNARVQVAKQRCRDVIAKAKGEQP